MKRDERNIEAILESALPSASKEQIESSRERVFARLRAERIPSGSCALPRRGITLRWLPAAALAAVLVAAIWTGLSWRSSVVFATVEAADGSLFRVSDGKTQPVRAGEKIAASDTIISTAGGGVLTLSDGSHVELRSQSQLSLERADDGARIRLDKGGVIVNAASQGAGHLYVRTKDLTVSVAGTVFLVKSEGAGSRVAVIQGEVHVQQDSASKKLRSGEQVATNPLMESHPVREEISWSRNSESLMSLLQQSAIPATAVVTKPLEFEVASIKPEPPSSDVRGGTAVYCRGIDGVVAPYRHPGAPEIPLGRCIGRHVNLISLIAIAYDLKVTNPGLGVTGGPDWVRDFGSAGYEIEAKAEDPEHVTKDQLRQMLQTLAAERFKLKMSRETREIDGLTIELGRGGMKFQESPGEEGLSLVPKMSPGRMELTISGRASMKTLAESMSFAFPPYRRVVDKTGLTGTYMISLSYSFAPPPPSENGRRGGGGGVEPGAAGVAALRDALQDQLGLRLESAKVPEEFIVIEHAERLAEN